MYTMLRENMIVPTILKVETYLLLPLIILCVAFNIIICSLVIHGWMKGKIQLQRYFLIVQVAVYDIITALVELGLMSLQLVPKSLNRTSDIEKPH